MATRLEELQRKLAARQGTPGYEKNCGVIRAEIARLKAQPQKYDL